MYSHLQVMENENVIFDESITDAQESIKLPDISEETAFKKYLSSNQILKLYMNMGSNISKVNQLFIQPVKFMLLRNGEIALSLVGFFGNRKFNLSTSNVLLIEHAMKLFNEGNYRFNKQNERHCRNELIASSCVSLESVSDSMYSILPISIYKLIAISLLTAKSEKFSVISTTPNGRKRLSDLTKDFMMKPHGSLTIVNNDLQNISDQLLQMEESEIFEIDDEDSEDEDKEREDEQDSDLLKKEESGASNLLEIQ